ncbi:MAG: hypothetical protein IKV57_06835, partial [Clostridia bacterium]|nr:hypothetical protein [Clostridia bacterium]
MLYQLSHISIQKAVWLVHRTDNIIAQPIGFVNRILKLFSIIFADRFLEIFGKNEISPQHLREAGSHFKLIPGFEPGTSSL